MMTNPSLNLQVTMVEVIESAPDHQLEYQMARIHISRIDKVVHHLLTTGVDLVHHMTVHSLIEIVMTRTDVIVMTRTDVTVMTKAGRLVVTVMTRTDVTVMTRTD